jgi:hypothetical protein
MDYLVWRQRHEEMLREAEKESLSRAYQKANKGHGREGYGVANRTDGTVVGATQDRMIPVVRLMHPVVPR